jgi:hypothetical protein
VYICAHQRDTLKKVLNMADINVKDVKKANAKAAFRMAAENVFPLMPQFQSRGIDLQRPQDTIVK